jgi:hypothetical protein
VKIKEIKDAKLSKGKKIEGSKACEEDHLSSLISYKRLSIEVLE